MILRLLIIYVRLAKNEGNECFTNMSKEIFSRGSVASGNARINMRGKLKIQKRGFLNLNLDGNSLEISLKFDFNELPLSHDVVG